MTKFAWRELAKLRSEPSTHACLAAAADGRGHQGGRLLVLCIWRFCHAYLSNPHHLHVRPTASWRNALWLPSSASAVRGFRRSVELAACFSRKGCRETSNRRSSQRPPPPPPLRRRMSPPLALLRAALALLLLAGATREAAARTLQEWDNCTNFEGFAGLNNTQLSCAVAELQPPAAAGLSNFTLAWALGEQYYGDTLRLGLQLEDASWAAGAAGGGGRLHRVGSVCKHAVAALSAVAHATCHLPADTDINAAAIPHYAYRVHPPRQYKCSGLPTVCIP